MWTIFKMLGDYDIKHHSIERVSAEALFTMFQGT
jgi:hypothetical protein